MKKRIFTYLMLTCFPFLLLAQWTDNPMLNTEILDSTGQQVQPKIAVDPENGESYISWFSNFASGEPQWDVYMQRLDVSGNKMWSEDGLLISNHPTISWTTDYGLVIDNEGCAILVTQDVRTGNRDVFAYRISPEGDFLWGADGIAITNDPDAEYSPKAMVDQDGNIVFGYETSPADTSQKSEICLRKFSPEGQSLWDNITIISEDTTHCFQSHFLSAEDNSTIAVWIESVNTDTTVGYWPKMYPYAQKIDSDGNFVWANNVAIDALPNMPLDFFSPPLISDGNSGFFIGWRAYPEDALFHSCYAQHINSDGVAQWTPNGVLASDSIGFMHYLPSLTYLPQHDELFLFWSEEIVYGAYDDHIAILGQKFSDTGERLWTNHGKLFDGWYPFYDTASFVEAIRPSTADDFTVFFSRSNWEYIPDTIPALKIYAMQINREGDFVWDNEKSLVSSAIGQKGFFDISDLVQNQWIITWEDNRDEPIYGEPGIYAQNISIDGNLGIITGINENNKFIANTLLNFPNPFQNQTTIEYELTQEGNVSLDLLDVNGRFIKHLYKGKKPQGTYSKQFDVSGLTPGLYLIRLQSGNAIVYRKMIKN